MRKLYNEFFYISKHEKIREKVMLARVAMTVVIMVICLAAMSITAYAYFSCNVTSGSNIIKAANFDAQIQVKDQNGVSVNPSSIDGKKTAFVFASQGTYTVKLEKGNSTANTGFCVVYAGNEKYYTQQIGVDINVNNSVREFIEFDLKINEPNIIVTIESHWGTSSYYNFDIDENNAFYIMSNPRKEIVIGNPINGVSDSDEEKDAASDATTETETTQTEVVHTVASGESLSKIAEIYNTTSKRIATYNEITDANNIQVGQKIKIPPAEWVIPETSMSQTTTPLEPTPHETSDPTGTTETSSAESSAPTTTSEPTESSAPTTTSEPTESSAPTTTSEPTESTASAETQSVEETTGVTNTEANE